MGVSVGVVLEFFLDDVTDGFDPIGAQFGDFLPDPFQGLMTDHSPGTLQVFDQLWQRLKQVCLCFSRAGRRCFP